MNKLFNKIAGSIVGIAMAVGVGVAVGSGAKEARSVEAADEYVQTSFEDLATGDVGIIVSFKDSTYRSLSNNNGTYSAPTASSVSVADGKISSAVSDSMLWEVTNSNGSFSFKVNDGTTYLYCTATNNGVRVGTNSNNVFTIKDDYLHNTATNRYLGVYNNSDWRCYTSINNNIAGQTFSFFVKKSGGSSTTQLETPSPIFNRADSSISWTIDSNADHYEASVDGGSLTTVSTPFDVSDFAYGSHTFALVAKGDGTNYSDSDPFELKFALIEHDGTLADPYSAVDAIGAIDIEDGISNVYAKGIVSRITEKYNATYNNVSFDISDDGTITSPQLRGFRTVGTEEYPINSTDSVQVGDVVILNGNLTKYGTTYEFEADNKLVYLFRKSVSSIVISGSITKNEYTTAETWDVTGLTVTAIYNDETEEVLSSSDVTWSFNYATPSEIGVGEGQSLVITATYKSFEDSVTETVNVTQASMTNTSGLVPGTYYIKYNSNYFTGSIASGKGASSSTKPEDTNAQFTFTLVGDDTWTVVNGSNNYLTIGNTSTSLGYSSSFSTLIVEAGSTTGTFKIKGSSGRYVAWYDSNSEFRTYTTGAIDMLLESVSAETYTITYIANGGSGTMTPTTGTLPLVSDCTFTAPEGKEFSKWNTSSDGTGVDYAVGTGAQSNVTLYAIWVKQSNSTVITSSYLNISSEITSQSVLEATDGIEYTVAPSSGQKVKSQSASGDNKFSSDPAILFGKSGAFIRNTTEYFDPIEKLEIFSNGGSSTNVIVAVSFSTSEITDSLSGGTKLATADHVYDFSPDSTEDYTFFRVQVTSAHNAQIQIRITFKNEESTYTAADFASDFKTALYGTSGICDAGGNTNFTSLQSKWIELAGKFDTLSAEDKALYKDNTQIASASQDIKDTVELYDYIATKYGHTLEKEGELADFDFMDRGITPRSSGRISIFGNMNRTESNTILVVVIASVISVAAIGGYFFLKKKKEK